MRTERLVALNAFPYASESLKKGDPFLAEPEHAKILKAIGRAEDDPTPATTPKASPVATEAGPVGERGELGPQHSELRGESVPESKVPPPWQAGTKATASKPKKTQE